MLELNRLEQRRTHQVLVVNNADVEKTRAWTKEVEAGFPVLAQEKYAISKRLSWASCSLGAEERLLAADDRGR